MNISGLQKVTLLDFPGKIACTVFFAACNLRCPFCHNASLVLPEKYAEPLMTEEELLAFLASRQGRLDGVCITGGEPTLQKELPELLRRIKDLGFLVKLDTNGSQPKVLRELVEQGLVDYVAMDIKNAPEYYAETCGGVDVLAAVRESVDYLLSDVVDYEFRTTVVHPLHTEERLLSLAKWIRGAKRYYLQGFVDSGDLVGKGMEAVLPQQMQEFLAAVKTEIPVAELRGI